MINRTIITTKIGKKIYEKICSCTNGVFLILPQTYLKPQYSKIFKDIPVYTQEMQDRADKLKIAKLITKKNKEIDLQRTMIKSVLDASYELSLKLELCDILDEFYRKQTQIKFKNIKKNKQQLIKV